MNAKHRTWCLTAAAALIPASVGVVRIEAQEQVSSRAVHVKCDEEGGVVNVRSGSAPLQRAIDASRPGASILVSGTCHENVTVPVGKDSITLDGRGTAAIAGPDSTRPTILVNGRHVTIRGLTITGGQFGIHVREGGSGHIDGNSISDAAVYGIAVSVVSTAVIVNNTIRNNGQAGIGLAENANAFIGFVTTADVDASPNLITGNGTQGIVVFRNSYARIVGNDISQNRANGIVVREDSHALITDNTVNGNGQNGIAVMQGSGVILGAGPGAPNSIFTRPNTTTIANGAFGILCQLSGFTDGRLGSLNGASGAESYVEGCVPSLTP
jgi:parallel beta-helix repeat protein